MNRLYGELKTFDFSSVLNNDNVGTAFSNFYNIVDGLIEKNLPLKNMTIKPKIHFKPWYSEGLKVSNKHKIRLYRKQLHNPSEYNVTNYRNYKNMYNKLLRRAERTYF